MKKRKLAKLLASACKKSRLNDTGCTLGLKAPTDFFICTESAHCLQAKADSFLPAICELPKHKRELLENYLKSL